MGELDKKIEKYLTEADSDANALASLTTGLRRIQYKFEKANTPAKYQEVFGMVSELINNFPMKSKIIWAAVAAAYNGRFGATPTTEE